MKDKQESELREEEQEEYTFADSPGKIRTLFFIKYSIVAIVLCMVVYGFFFDKWSIEGCDSLKVKVGKDKKQDSL